MLCIRDVWLQRCVTNATWLVKMLWLEDGFLVCKSSEQRPLFPGTSLLKHLDLHGEGHSFLAFLLLVPKLAVMEENTLHLVIVLFGGRC